MNRKKKEEKKNFEFSRSSAITFRLILFHKWTFGSGDFPSSYFSFKATSSILLQSYGFYTQYSIIFFFFEKPSLIKVVMIQSELSC